MTRSAPLPRSMRVGRVASSCALLVVVPCYAANDTERGNFFDDPFIQVTAAIKECATPEGPMVTRAEMRTEAHLRVERGTRCFQSGQCRLPNSYLYDKEIIPRVKKAIEADGRFADTSIWAEGRRRWVWLKGCVRSPAQSRQIEQLVRRLDDVEAVINELTVVASKTTAPQTRSGTSK